LIPKLPPHLGLLKVLDGTMLNVQNLGRPAIICLVAEEPFLADMRGPLLANVDFVENCVT
jgi:hypothetical protein